MTKMQVTRQGRKLSEDCKSTAPPVDYQGRDKSAVETVAGKCHQDDDRSTACECHSDLETQLASCITSVLSESHAKTSQLVWPPLPASPDPGWNIFPPWIAVSIVILSIIGILGAIFELRYQFNGTG